MNRELFWVHKSVFGEAEAGVGFSTFSAPHLIWLALLTLFIAASVARYRRSGAKGRAGRTHRTGAAGMSNKVSPSHTPRAIQAGSMV